MTKNPRTLALIATGVLLVSMSLFFILRNRAGTEYQLSISAGSEKGLRNSIAKTIDQFSRSVGVNLELVPTGGSQEALAQVNRGQLDFALVQGGLVETKFPNVRQVAVLHVEPLHLLVKPHDETPDHLTLKDVASWMAKKNRLTVNVSTRGSGTNAVATELLRFFRIKSDVNIELTNLSYAELVDSARSISQMPDAVFTVSSLPSPVAAHLVAQHDYRPVELPVANAFRIDWSVESEQGDRQLIQRRHLTDTTIPAFTYRVDPPVPSRDIRTLGARLQLVTNENVPAEAVEKMAEVIYSSSYSSVTDPPLNIELLQTSAEFELHDGAASYLERKTPIITERVVEITEQLLAILGTVCGGLLFVWQAVSYTRRRHRDRQFLMYIGRVGEIENRAMKYELSEEMTVEDLVQLQSELNVIKSEMIKQFQNGDIDGADTLSTFLMQVNDVNENLNRTILHERRPREELNRRQDAVNEPPTE